MSDNAIETKMTPHEVEAAVREMFEQLPARVRTEMQIDRLESAIFQAHDPSDYDPSNAVIGGWEDVIDLARDSAIDLAGEFIKLAAALSQRGGNPERAALDWLDNQDASDTPVRRKFFFLRRELMMLSECACD
jgi:hypothetical protein